MAAERERALIVEDDPITQAILRQYFGGEGYEAEAVSSLAEARQAFRRLPADVLLLDIALPDGDGVEFAREVRRESAVGIIFVTSKNQDSDRIKALEAAGDDYVTKPINLRELLARVRALSRRRALDRRFQPDDVILSFAGWIIDLKRRELFRQDGGVLRLTRGEFDLLAALALARGGTVTRDYLVEVVSNRDIAVTPRTVDSLVARLRGKLEQVVPMPCPIRTVKGEGYRLDSPVEIAG
ncbi:response regulator transcription factor [Bradyrhizobium sp. CB82]|uniref:response regulator transcription factor n=1 Tax=Bradyrhizobium sp. CB82 TaxID=3039159 RepID=UPI0024B13220|nr:response regulator transcription factor [Bradyrhizobium sp. CB82]WFU37245.1 response regulator transcription factor [Bradyrhizobium sp. CB82]